MSRAYHASIGIFRKQFYTFDLENDFHISLATVEAINNVSNTNQIIVGPITFNFKGDKASAIFKGSRIGKSAWIASEYADTLIMLDLPATREEIQYLTKSLIHLLQSK